MRHARIATVALFLSACSQGASSKQPTGDGATPAGNQPQALAECVSQCDAKFKACERSDPRPQCLSKCNAACTGERQDGTVPTTNQAGECYNACTIGCDSSSPPSQVDCHMTNAACLEACPGRDGACLLAGDAACDSTPENPAAAGATVFDADAAQAAARKISVADCGSDGRGLAIVTWNESGDVYRVHVNWGPQPSDFGAVNSCVRDRLSKVRIAPFNDGYPHSDKPEVRTRDLSLRIEVGETAEFFCSHNDASPVISSCLRDKAACMAYSKRYHASDCAPARSAWCRANSDGSWFCVEGEKECRDLPFVGGPSACKELTSLPR
jgi:hypothetical protein